jgi:hypothetical protein
MRVSSWCDGDKRGSAILWKHLAVRLARGTPDRALLVKSGWLLDGRAMVVAVITLDEDSK